MPGDSRDVLSDFPAFGERLGLGAGPFSIRDRRATLDAFAAAGRRRGKVMRTAVMIAAVAALLALQAPAADATPAAVQLAQTPAASEVAYVRGVQRELLAHGYKSGPIDGIAGGQTRAAVRAYQRDAGLTADGEADRRLLDHLKFALPKVYAFGQPVTGHVLDVQRALAERGYYRGPHDGLAGPATQSAVSRFQADAGLPADTAIDSRLLQQIRDAPAEVKAGPSF
jgi:peptidoglycan hydrolase-like protein with peptidoglycan-binding domain